MPDPDQPNVVELRALPVSAAGTPDQRVAATLALVAETLRLLGEQQIKSAQIQTELAAAVTLLADGLARPPTSEPRS